MTKINEKAGHLAGDQALDETRRGNLVRNLVQLGVLDAGTRVVVNFPATTVLRGEQAELRLGCGHHRHAIIIHLPVAGGVLVLFATTRTQSRTRTSQRLSRHPRWDA
jgi:hypothetical protein